MTASDVPPTIDGTVDSSFAFATISERWPKILAKIVDQLHQYHPQAFNKYGEEGGADVKAIISKISELRYRIVTDKPLTKIASDSKDCEIWNDQLRLYQKQVGEVNATWFKLPWLFTECFMYQKLHEFFLATKHFKDYDPFALEKQRSYHEDMAHMISLSTDLNRDVDNDISGEAISKILLRFLQASLWGNKCDLSLSGGDPRSMSATVFQELDELRSFILVDDLEKACKEFLLKKRDQKRVDIILDNAGLEVFIDICLADLIISKKLADEVLFYGKKYPWYVSDTTQEDYEWIIAQLMNSDNKQLKKTGLRWHQFKLEGRFTFKTHAFFTLYFPYCDMEKKTPDLYADLSLSDFLILKGDLNYRKLVGDRYWPCTTPFKTALRGFKPTSFLSLRTLKAETVVGLSQATVDKMETKFGKRNDWMVTGDYAVAQLFSKTTE